MIQVCTASLLMPNASARRVAKNIEPNGSFDSRSDLYEPYLASSMSGLRQLIIPGVVEAWKKALRMTDKDYAYIFRGRDFAKFFPISKCMDRLSRRVPEINCSCSPPEMLGILFLT
jgi:hypothetical protein